MKMSKSNPDSAIFMTDSKKDIERKMRKAYCPEGIIIENPILEYAKYFVFEREDIFKVERPSKFGGDLEFSSYSDLEVVYQNKDLHPADLKKAVSFYINKQVEPVQDAFETNDKLRELHETVMGFKVTRLIFL
jgi:tyrosyl-tRNA synthetase